VVMATSARPVCSASLIISETTNMNHIPRVPACNLKTHIYRPQLPVGKSAQTTPEQSVVRKTLTTSSRRLICFEKVLSGESYPSRTLGVDFQPRHSSSCLAGSSILFRRSIPVVPFSPFNEIYRPCLSILVQCRLSFSLPTYLHPWLSSTRVPA